MSDPGETVGADDLAEGLVAERGETPIEPDIEP
jgi:hypothetical protein